MDRWKLIILVLAGVAALGVGLGAPANASQPWQVHALVGPLFESPPR